MIGTAFRFTLVVVAGATLACSSAAPSASGTAPTPAVHDRSVLTAEELHSGNDQNLYDVVLRLRPDWLRTRGASSIATGRAGNPDADAIQVYVDQLRAGGPDALRQIATNHATLLKFYTPAEAQQRFGTGNVNGAIQVTTAPPPP
jgi:hypothetical protein